MNMQLWQCFSTAKPFHSQAISKKSQSRSKKSRISKSGFKTAKLATLLTRYLTNAPESEMITIRFAGWISGRIVSLQPDTDIQKLLSNGNRIRIRISETLLSMFEDSHFWKKLHIAWSIIHYLQKHLFSLLCHDSKSVYGVISVP